MLIFCSISYVLFSFRELRFFELYIKYMWSDRGYCFVWIEHWVYPPATWMDGWGGGAFISTGKKLNQWKSILARKPCREIQRWKNIKRMEEFLRPQEHVCKNTHGKCIFSRVVRRFKFDRLIGLNILLVYSYSTEINTDIMLPTFLKWKKIHWEHSEAQMNPVIICYHLFLTVISVVSLLISPALKPHFLKHS